VHRPHRPVRPPAREDRPVRSLAGRDPRSSSRSKRGPSRTRRLGPHRRRPPDHRPRCPPVEGRLAAAVRPPSLPRPRSRAPSPGRRDRPRAPRRTRDRARGRRPATSRPGRGSPRTRRPRPRTPGRARPGASRARGCPDASPRAGPPTSPRRRASRPALRPRSRRTTAPGRPDTARSTGRGGCRAEAETTTRTRRGPRSAPDSLDGLAAVRRPTDTREGSVPIQTTAGSCGLVATAVTASGPDPPGPRLSAATRSKDSPSSVERNSPASNVPASTRASSRSLGGVALAARNDREALDRAVRQPDRDRPRLGIDDPEAVVVARVDARVHGSVFDARQQKSLRRTQETYPTPP